MEKKKGQMKAPRTVSRSLTQALALEPARKRGGKGEKRTASEVFFGEMTYKSAP